MRLCVAAGLLLGLSSCAMGGRPAPRGDFFVFFTERSAALDPQAAMVVAQAAALANGQPGARVVVYGYTDHAGSRQGDMALSQRRAERVADALAKAGVAPVRIVPEGQGQSGDLTGVENRRVEIVIEH